MLLPLRRGLSAVSASALVRRAISSAAADPASRPPPWAMIRGIRHAPAVRSPSPRASLLHAEPPHPSYLLVPDHLIDRRPSAEPYGDTMGFVSGKVYATSLLLLIYMDARVPASVISDLIARATRESGLSKHVAAAGATRGSDLADPEPEYTRFVCNPLSGELFRLPDIEGTEQKTMFPGCRNTGLLTRSAAGYGPPDSYAVAVLLEDCNGGTFNMRRFLSRTGEWKSILGLPSPLPLPLPRRMNMYTEAVAFAGRLWWADLTWGIVSADPFSDRPELHFVELPRNSACLVPRTNIVQEQGMHRRLVVSEGRLRYIEVSQKDPFVLSSFALDDGGSSWTLEHQVALGRICEVKGEGPWDTPRIGVLDPLNASVICVIVGNDVVAVDMEVGKVLGCSPVDDCEGPAWGITTCLKPCVLSPWLASSKIPTAGTSLSNKGDVKRRTLSDILFRVDRDKKN